MPARMIFVTGISGSGKSTLAKKMSEMGYITYDADTQISRWEDKQGNPVEVPPHGQTSQAFDDSHDWNIPPSALREISQANNGQTVYVYGGSSNEYQIANLFDQVIYLTLDEPEMVRRIESRHNNDFGKLPYQMKHLKEWRVNDLQHWGELKAVILDASRPLEDVLADIINITNK